MIKQIAISKITFNKRNPRHGALGVLSSEEESISYLLKKEKIRELAKHIAINGLDPLTMTAVVTEKEKFYIVEGNRRLCALKLLNKPELAQTDKQRNFFTNLKQIKKLPIPTKLNCYVFENIEDSKIWVTLRHESGQPAGIRQWGPEEKAYSDPNSKDRLSMQLKVYAIDKVLLLKSYVDECQITTLTRYLGNPEVRKVMGITNKKDLIVNWPLPYFNGLVKSFLNDCLSGVVTSEANKKAITDYANTLASSIKDTPEKLKRAADLVPDWWSKGTSQSPENKQILHRKSRKKGLIEKNWTGFEHLGKGVHDTPIRDIAQELCSIDCNKFPFATACLFRMLMEWSTKRYLFSKGDTKKYNARVSLSKLYQDASSSLAAETDLDLDLKPLRVAISDKDSLLSSDTIHKWVHGTLVPSQNDLESIWKNLGKTILKLLELSKKQS